jgi:hypothetical protein
MATSSAPGPLDRVAARLPDGTLEALDALGGADRTSLLLELARRQASRTTPADVMRRWAEDRFVRPGSTDPRRLWPVEARLWQLLPPDVEAVELSPLTPLGTCAATADVAQHRLVSTVRGSEVMADPTNALALVAAERRRAQPTADREQVHVAALAPVVRAQRFAGPGLRSHFRLLALVSSARDRGGARTEADLLVRHVSTWARCLAGVLPGRRHRLLVTAWGGGAVPERVRDTVVPEVTAALTAERVGDEPGPVEVVLDTERTQGAAYYRGAGIGLRVLGEDGELLDVGDGGVTDWTARLLGDAKERCVVSCLATSRVAELT